MEKIKIRYVAQVEINGEVDENEKGLLPFEDMKRNVSTELTPRLKEVIINAIDIGDFNVDITQMYADVWRTED